MKYKLLKILAVLLVFTALFNPFFVSAEGSCHWYIKRRGRECPTFPPEAEKVSENGGFYVGKSGEKKIYLTFDAGYENGNVEKILDTLNQENVPAAFFLLDNIIIKNPDLIKRMADEGHLVCNHTRNHKNLSSSSKEEIRQNLYSLEKICLEKTGVEMAKYFRFPEGRYSIDAIKSVNELGYKTVFWSFGYDDWDNQRQPDTEKAIAKILSNTHDGAVILLHPTSKTNADILPTLIKEWRKMEYSFGTLDELTK